MTVELLVGNNICCPAQFEARVTPASSGPESEIVTYSVWTVDPTVAQGVQLRRQANPQRLISLPQPTAYIRSFQMFPTSNLQLDS